MANDTNNLISQAEVWVADAIYRYPLDDEFNYLDTNYAVGLTALPDPSKVDIDDSIGLIPALVIFLEIPSNQEGETIYSAPIVAPFTLTQERVKEVVKKTLDSLKEARDQNQVDKIESDS